ncbi:MAG: molybdenum cofactor guanylyltransferase [Halodesulfurarchaeum sp.]
MRAGVVLCGGKSTRFGTEDKACSPLAGTPLVRHVADRIAPVVDELVVSCRREQRSAIQSALEGYPLPVRFALDENADQGPLHGMCRGLSETDASSAAVVACDMPFVDPGFLSSLFDLAAESDGAIPRTSDGWYQPLQSVYRVAPTVDAIRSARANGVERPIEAIESLDYVVIEGADLDALASDWTFFNVNTRADRDVAAKRLRSSGGSEQSR